MKIRISRADLVPVMILMFVTLNGLFSQYIEYTKMWNYASILLIVLTFISNKKWAGSILKNKGLMISFLISIILIMIGIFTAESSAFLSVNLLKILYPVIVYLLLLYVVDREVTTFFFEKAFKFFNLMWLINLFVLWRQILGTGFMIKSKWLSLNSYYEDQCCGLFGNSGTHELSMFSIFMLVYNLYYCEYVLEGKDKKRGIIIYTIITEGLMLYFSIYNENTALYVLLPGVAMLYYFLKTEWISHNISQKMIKYGKYIVFVLLLAGVLLVIPVTREYIRNVFFSKLNKVLVFEALTTNGSNERLAIPSYALSHLWGWLFGKGFGAWKLQLGGYMGFRHFGLSSVGSFITLGGIWFYLAYCSFYACMLKRMCANRKQRGRIWIVCMLVVVFLTFYTVFFSSVVSSLWIAMSFMVYGEMHKRIQAKKCGVT